MLKRKNQKLMLNLLARSDKDHLKGNKMKSKKCLGCRYDRINMFSNSQIFSLRNSEKFHHQKSTEWFWGGVKQVYWN